VVAGVGKPLAKAAIKGGIVLYEKSKGVIAEVGETLEDIVAEAKAELAETQSKEIAEIETQAEVS
jgi:predicted DNA-binding antitoxin AbrB/MazE fold protein